jgi:diacylglycerol kinase family enzyme
VRIRDFGGALNHFVPGASLHCDDLRLVAFKTRSRLRYFCFMMAAVIGRHTFSHDIEVLDAVSVECRSRKNSTAHVFAEADGELLGELPVRIEIVPQAITLLIPAGARP